jgi:hypothetical protein
VKDSLLLHNFGPAALSDELFHIGSLHDPCDRVHCHRYTRTPSTTTKHCAIKMLAGICTVFTCSEGAIRHDRGCRLVAGGVDNNSRGLSFLIIDC